jgi:hypothetical protein
MSLRMFRSANPSGRFCHMLSRGPLCYRNNSDFCKGKIFGRKVVSHGARTSIATFGGGTTFYHNSHPPLLAHVPVSPCLILECATGRISQAPQN